MLRRHASLVLACLLIVLVMAACLVRTGRPARRGYGPPPAEHSKHKKQKKPQKHKKHKKHN